VKVRGMLIPHQREKLSIDLIANHLKMLSGSFVSAIGTGNVTLKLAREPINTYRMISLNNEKILLYLTHAKESDVAVLVHRGSNAGLIDDAISTFDGLWKDAIDVAEIVMKTLSLEKG
jgi:energy-converting hydrogenase Eha subunit C